MYIIDGIAYAGEQPQPVSVKSVRPLENYTVLVTFSDNRKNYSILHLCSE